MDKHPQHTRITHVNSTGLDPFSFAVKDWERKKRWSKKKTGRWEGVGVEGWPFFSQMKWKARVAAICQSKRRVQRWVRLRGDFFYFFFTTMFRLKLHGARRRRKRGEGVMLNSWGEKDGYIDRERGRLQTARCFSMFSPRLICCFFAKYPPN